MKKSLRIRWPSGRNCANSKKEEPPAGITLVSVSREYGSNGAMLAERIAAELEYILFHQEVIHEMAASAKTSKRIVETLVGAVCVPGIVLMGADI